MINIKEFNRYKNIVVDSSVVTAPTNIKSFGRNGSLSFILHDPDFSSLESLTLDAFQLMIHNFIEVENLLGRPQIRIIPEVIQETVRLQELLNRQYDFFLKSARRCEGTERELTSEQYGCLERLGQVCSKVHAVVRKIKKRTSFLDWDNSHNFPFLHAATENSHDLDEAHLESLSNLRNPSYLGYSLQTDHKLAASSFVYSYQGDVLLLTRDQGLNELVLRLGIAFGKNGRKGNVVACHPVSGVYSLVQPDGKLFHSIYGALN